jgi:hypothetical protein
MAVPALDVDINNFDINRSSYQAIICYQMQDSDGEITVMPVVVADLGSRPLFPIPVQIHSLEKVVEKIQRFGEELGSTVKRLELRVKTLVDENLWKNDSQWRLLRNLTHLENLSIDYFYAPDDKFSPRRRYDNECKFLRRYDNEFESSRRYDNEFESSRRYDNEFESLRRHCKECESLRRHGKECESLRRYDDECKLLRRRGNTFEVLQRYDKEFEFCNFHSLKVIEADGTPERVFSVLYRFPSVTSFNLCLKVDNAPNPEHTFWLMDALIKRNNLNLPELQCLSLNFLDAENDNQNTEIPFLPIFIYFNYKLNNTVRHELVDCCFLPSLSHIRYPIVYDLGFHRVHTEAVTHRFEQYPPVSSIVSLKSFEPHILYIELESLESIFAGEEAKGTWFPVGTPPAYPLWPKLKEIRFDTDSLILSQVSCFN